MPVPAADNAWDSYVRSTSFRLIAALAVSTAMISACGAGGSPQTSAAIDTRTARSVHVIDTSVLRTAQFDYDHKGSPEELVKSRDHESIVVKKALGVE